MAKQLVKQCGDVLLNGIHISQGRNSEGLWQAYLLMDGKLLDIDGDELKIGLSGSKKETLGQPQVEPWTTADFEANKALIFTRIQAMFDASKTEFTGST